MALVTNFKCQHCSRTVHEIVCRDNLCGVCRSTLAQIAKDNHMALCASRPLEERIRVIEEQLYDADADRRLRALEAKNQKY
jgi:hypothetical protein